MSTDLAVMPGRHLNRRADVVDVVQHLRELWDLADILVRSRMLPSSVATTEAAVAIMLKGRELGLGPMAAFAGITVIQGKPVVSPQLMLSLIHHSGLLEDMAIEDDGHACRVTMKRKGRSPHTTVFSMDHAREMQLAGKDNWKKMAPVMRQWRAVGANCRITFPDVIDGLYTPEELGAEVNDEGEIIDGEVVEAPAIEAPSRQPSAKGLFSNEHRARTREFSDWLKAQCEKINARWQDEWAEKLTSAMNAGLAVPEKVADVISPWQAKGHLLKWAKDSERIDPAILPEDLKPAQSEAYLALVFGDHKKALIGEMGVYIARQRTIKADVVYRKFPELAPDGWLAEQEEATEPARGGAWEPSEQDRHDVAEVGGQA